MTVRFVLAAASALLGAGASAQSDQRAAQVIAAVGEERGPDSRFAIAFSDLNDDHRQEAIVHLAGREHCGSGGCTTLVMTYTTEGWVRVGRLTVSRLPIYRLPGHHGGWYDLGVSVGGGGMMSGVRAVSFSKGRYASNPTVGRPVDRLPLEATLVMPATSEFYPL
ncbi:hypothetical protein G7076_08265 [Sphingomonas sp. HDW15A]|uniref:hypothetical protein n=1 Tax=Sphingomonas sp. HDW15A TaxID=2714942 RepID=UPI00140789DB|nr:hypothetical protein [Sphingomonas sp. HDW15A]QIK96436.1 hypothetical protein G7076_08265 [Sphingomonas sp. HDW15A]